MPSVSYLDRRGEIATYFDRTAVQAWSRLTSDAPLGRIRATVRAGRERMRTTLLDWLPQDLSGRTLLDAGCGTGALAVLAARRGARVLAIDLSPTLIDLARTRCPAGLDISFCVGDMLDPPGGQFDHVVAMDSLIHYRSADAVSAVAKLAGRSRSSVFFTFAPRTPVLGLMHAVGRLFPRGDRAPAIEPVAEGMLRRLLTEDPALTGWQQRRTLRIVSGFYTSQAQELAA